MARRNQSPARGRGTATTTAVAAVPSAVREPSDRSGLLSNVGDVRLENVRRAVSEKPSHYSLFKSLMKWLVLALIVSFGVVLFPFLILGILFLNSNPTFTQDSALVASFVITTTLTVLGASPALALLGLDAYGWAPLAQTTESLLICMGLFVCATFLRRIMPSAVSKWFDALLQRTLAPWALVNGFSSLPLIESFGASLILRLIIYAIGTRCRAPEPHVPGTPGLRVLITGDSFAPKLDGPNFIIQNVIKELVALKHIVHVFCSNGYPGVPGGPEQFGATVTRGPGIEVAPKHKVTFPSVWFIFALMKFRPHVVHYADITPANFVTLPIAWLLGVPCILAHHSRIDLYACYTPWPLFYVAPWICQVVIEFFGQFADGILLGDASQAAQPWFHHKEILHSWVTGCDTVFFNPAKADRKAVKATYMAGKPDLPIVLFVGRLDPQKQVELLVDLVEEVNPPGQPAICNFLIIGDGASRDGMLKAFGDRADVVMPGVVKGEPVAQCFASADFFFTPTVTGTLDMVFLESMASGLPVVGPNCVAIPQVVTDGVNGMLYAPCDMKDAARAIREAIPLVERMRPKCRPLAETMFTHQNAVRKALNLYETVLQRKKSGE